jgi:hypothetical protein
MATPTIAGAKEMLAYLGAKPKAEGSVAHKVILTDLREEAVVYINGTPFVLRELNKPVDTLKHVGITGPVVCHRDCYAILKTSHEPQHVFPCSCTLYAGGTHGGTSKRRYIV